MVALHRKLYSSICRPSTCTDLPDNNEDCLGKHKFNHVVFDRAHHISSTFLGYTG
jgi:hypothetical protein